jgi:hypothetical protein
MTKIMVAFRNIANTPKRAHKVSKCLNSHTLGGSGRGYIHNVTTTGEIDCWEEAGVLRQTNCDAKAHNMNVSEHLSPISAHYPSTTYNTSNSLEEEEKS